MEKAAKYLQHTGDAAVPKAAEVTEVISSLSREEVLLNRIAVLEAELKLR